MSYPPKEFRSTWDKDVRRCTSCCIRWDGDGDKCPACTPADDCLRACSSTWWRTSGIFGHPGDRRVCEHGRTWVWSHRANTIADLSSFDYWQPELPTPQPTPSHRRWWQRRHTTAAV
jgi:hypothetical protein